jgi:hypothetical protein
MAEDTKVSGQPEARVDFVALKPGHRVGRYEIVAVLGQGGFGITYRARDGQLGRDVALKEYLPTALAVRQDGTTVLPRSTDVADDFIWGRARFVAEGRTLATLHEAAAIVKVFDFLEANGTAYIVMELVRGETLEARASRGMPGPAEVDAILWPLLDGLEQVHEAGFLHRDIKPANILLGPSGRPTLIDFGASRAAIAGRTTAMTAIFTPGYAAAEQFTSARQGPWTDIYGLAATMYRLLSGMVPPSAFDRMLEDHYKPLTALALRNFSPRLLAGIDAGMAVRVDDRPPSIAKWRSLLIGAAPVPADDRTQVVVPVARESAPAPPSSVQVPTGSAAGPAPAKSRAPFYVGATVAAMLLLAAGGWFALAPRLGGIGVHDMKVEDLERVLAERRKADAEAADKRRLEEEAQKKASADADAKVAADAEVVRAQAERQKAEVELARLREQLEAERKATAERQELADAKARREAAEAEQRRRETEMAALKRAEEEARRKAEADAESKRRADEALAAAQAERARAEADARAKADEEARRKAEASARELAEAQVREKAAAETSAKADLEAKKAAEATETGLSLSQLDRQRVQVALTALGFNTNGRRRKRRPGPLPRLAPPCRRRRCLRLPPPLQPPARSTAATVAR